MRLFLLVILCAFTLCATAATARAECILPGGAICETGPCGAETRPTGHIIYNDDHGVLQVCQGNGTWHALGPVPPCEDSGPGAICGDGSVFAGLTPDGNVPMYTTPADAGLFAWNDGNPTGYTTTNQTSTVTGQANTAALIGIDSNGDVGGVQPHRAAQHCADLMAHGQSDWYLPARDELNVLWVNRAAIGGFDLSGSYPAGWYRSSSENGNTNARLQNFGDGSQFSIWKDDAMSVRCVRKA